MFSQTTEYALRAMACLALTPGALVSTTALATQTKVPNTYLAKILQELSAAGFVESRRGVGGGYRLARPASDILLIDIINHVGNVRRIVSCPLGLPSHGARLCALHKRLDLAAAAMLEFFDGVTLQTILDDTSVPHRPLCRGESLTVSASPRRT